ncbi:MULTISPECIES: permease [unclassified Clostridium]|uniref:permease n=1 Tax=unclassified Clostridium TaxID=2614128 RepID=UPI0002976DA2|nr:MULTISPECIES: permease [unclassified Clostridium]EKQ57232.1 MAG: putative permease [Clostridium sp. Maddingley MBC34-26]
MNIKVEIVLGFLESGKTTFINSMLKSDELQNETIVVIQDEFGKCEIKADFNNSKRNNKIIAIKNDGNGDITANYIKQIIQEYSPDRIFIEVNGMKNSNAIIDIFNDKNIKKLCKIDDIITVIDVKEFSILFRNMKGMLVPHIFNSNTIVLNNVNKLNKKEFINIQKEIRNINETARLLEHVSLLNVKELYQEEYIEISQNQNFYLKTLFYISLLMFLFIFLTTLSMSDASIYTKYFDEFKRFYTVFISILIQGFPFILVGSFVSAIIQICISRETFIKIFPKNIFLSCIIAALAGLLFPICDCGTIPVVKGLIKKKIPLAAGVTFMLAAPIVNPIAIISTVYAFQGMKSVVIYRIIAGIIISILVGLIMQFCTKKNESILKSDDTIIDCSCGFCDDNYVYSKSKLDKIKAVFIHAGDEFFNIGKFMIIGTFLSSIFQTIVSINNNMFVPKDSRISLLLMMLLSFLLSVCSTSDAFIAKGFLKQFSINSIMGFLVAGPMLDIKNTIMLFGSFKKKFVLKLISTILLVSFGVLINLKLL